MPLHLRHHHTNAADVVAPTSTISASKHVVLATEDVSPTNSAALRSRKRKYSKPFSTQPWKILGLLCTVVMLVTVTVMLLLLVNYEDSVPVTRRTFIRHTEQSIGTNELNTSKDNQQTRQHNNIKEDLPLSLVSITTPLEDIDMTNYTVRINTWKRPEQLKVSILHFLTCDRVAMIQVAWCTAQGPVPEWLLEYTSDAAESPRVTVELHEENSLNARFDVLHDPPTKGILSVDDDVLRPCMAVDVAFAKWTSHPDRLVGFDARTHVIQQDHATKKEHWKYGYLSETTRTNRYSITLSRFAFCHVDHLRSYTNDLSAEYRDMVTQHMNCEDILLSFWVSHLTDCQPPLLADYWAMKSMVKLYSPAAISGTSQHKQIRDECVDTFRKGLALDCLQRTEWIHHDPVSGVPSVWEAGAPATTTFHPAQESIQQVVTKWEKGGLSVMGNDIAHMIQETAALVFEHGLMEGTAPWKEKFQHTNA